MRPIQYTEEEITELKDIRTELAHKHFHLQNCIILAIDDYKNTPFYKFITRKKIKKRIKYLENLVYRINVKTNIVKYELDKTKKNLINVQEYIEIYYKKYG